MLRPKLAYPLCNTSSCHCMCWPIGIISFLAFLGLLACVLLSWLISCTSADRLRTQTHSIMHSNLQFKFSICTEVSILHAFTLKAHQLGSMETGEWLLVIPVETLTIDWHWNMSAFFLWTLKRIEMSCDIHWSTLEQSLTCRYYICHQIFPLLCFLQFN